jgi:NitT/TauT family transport system permease protein
MHEVRTGNLDLPESPGEGLEADSIRGNKIDLLEQELIARSTAEARRTRFSRIASPIVVVAALLIAWDLFVRASGLPTYIVPLPSLVAKVFVQEWPLLMEHSWPTISAMLVGFMFALVVGFLFALLTYSSKIVERGFYPLLVSMQAVPKIAVAPLFAIWFGFSLTTKALMAFLLAVFPIVINTLVGLRSIPPEKMLLARSIGLGAVRTFLKIRLPQALPSILGGAKIALALAFIGAIVGEFVGGGTGLGYLMQRANANLETPIMFASLILLAGYAILMFMVLEVIERLWLPWHLDRQPTGI